MEEIREIINLFEHLLTETEISAWQTFRTVCLNFFGIVKAENYKEFVEDLLNAYQTMGCNMPLKTNFLLSHFYLYPPILGAASDEHGEKFRQEYPHGGQEVKPSQNILADCFWDIIEMCLLPVIKE